MRARASIIGQLLVLFAVCWATDRVVPGRLRWPAFALLTLLGIWDQTPREWFRPAVAKPREAHAERFRADAAFYGEVERAMPGGTVFTLPYVPYPEVKYEHVRGYLHTATVRWSFGAVRGRETDLWQREVATREPREMLGRLAGRRGSISSDHRDQRLQPRR